MCWFIKVWKEWDKVLVVVSSSSSSSTLQSKKEKKDEIKKQVLSKLGKWEQDTEGKQKEREGWFKKGTKIKKTCYFIFIIFIPK